MSHEPQRRHATLYGIRVAAYHDLDKAQEHVRSLQGQGHQVAMASVTIAGREGVFHRVIVGRFTTEAAARSELRAMLAKGRLPAGANIVTLESVPLSASTNAK